MKFTAFSSLFLETSFHLLFPENVPLITLKELYTEYDESKKEPYNLNILMDLAKSDLSKILKKGPLKFKEFFPVFRDAILGLVFMHMKKIAHRDLKPENIMMMFENCYVIADFGIGKNLTYAE